MCSSALPMLPDLLGEHPPAGGTCTQLSSCFWYASLPKYLLAQTSVCVTRVLQRKAGSDFSAQLLADNQLHQLCVLAVHAAQPFSSEGVGETTRRSPPRAAWSARRTLGAGSAAECPRTWAMGQNAQFSRHNSGLVRGEVALFDCWLQMAKWPMPGDSVNEGKLQVWGGERGLRGEKTDMALLESWLIQIVDFCQKYIPDFDGPPFAGNSGFSSSYKRSRG